MYPVTDLLQYSDPDMFKWPDGTLRRQEFRPFSMHRRVLGMNPMKICENKIEGVYEYGLVRERAKAPVL